MFYIIRCYNPPSIDTILEDTEINTFRLTQNKEGIKYVQYFFKMLEQGHSKKNIKIIAEDIVEDISNKISSKDMDSLLKVYDQYYKAFQGRKSNALKFCLLKAESGIVVDILNVWSTYTTDACNVVK